MALEKKFTLKNFYSQMDKQITGIHTYQFTGSFSSGELNLNDANILTLFFFPVFFIKLL